MNPRAARYLRKKLAGGPAAANDIYAEGAVYDFKPKMLWRAAKALGLEMTKNGWQGAYVWSFPDEHEFDEVG